MRARAAAAEPPASAPKSGPRRAVKAAPQRTRSADRQHSPTEPAVPRPLASIPASSRRYVVVEHGCSLNQVARVIGEFSTLELAQALLRSELEWGNGAVVILDQRAGEAILDATSYPVRVSLRPPRSRRTLPAWGPRPLSERPQPRRAER